MSSGIDPGGRTVTAEATVIGVEPTGARADGDGRWRIRYVYLDRAGARHIGESDELDDQEAQGWQPGDIGGVEYAGDDPRRSFWRGSLPSGSGLE